MVILRSSGNTMKIFHDSIGCIAQKVNHKPRIKYLITYLFIFQKNVQPQFED